MSSSEERIILKDLFAHRKWRDIYFFHRRFLLSPGQIGEFLEKYQGFNVIERKGKRIRLTEHGVEWVLHNRKKIFFSVGSRYWAKGSESNKIPGKSSRTLSPSKMHRQFFERRGAKKGSSD